MNALPYEPQYVGSFRCIVKSWGIREPKEGSSTVMVSMELQIREAWDPKAEQWVSWEEINPPWALYANVCIVKKDGQPNQVGMDQLVQSVNWDGTLGYFMSFPKPYLVVVQTAKNEYNGKVSLQVNWLSHAASVPKAGGVANVVDETGVKSLEAQFGAMLRASVTKPTKAAELAPETPF